MSNVAQRSVCPVKIALLGVRSFGRYCSTEFFFLVREKHTRTHVGSRAKNFAGTTKQLVAVTKKWPLDSKLRTTLLVLQH